MGVCTDGIIFYGIEYGEDLPERAGVVVDSVDWWYGADDIYDKKMGVKAPIYPERSDFEGPKEWEEALDEYGAAAKRIEDARGCELSTHCSGEYPIYYLALNYKHRVSPRGYSICFNVVDNFFKVGPEDDKIIENYCEIMGLKYSQPKWYLASYYG